VTVIGEKLLVVKIRSAEGTMPNLDWRTQKDGLSFEPCSLPSDLGQKCISLVESLGLLFGAIDLVERDGEFFFLEINPNGEWGWLQKPTGMPIAETMCDLLVDLDLQKK
jgi:glutathione synthase/RimK-type ligase-like ATP-grasp enzyme